MERAATGPGYGYAGPSRLSLWSNGSLLSVGSRNSVLRGPVLPTYP